MMSVNKIRALAVAIVMVAAAFVAISTSAAARTTNEPSQPPIGPWIDEIIWSEELDRSKALTEIIAGTKDTIIFDITALADKQRALASDQLTRNDAAGLFDQVQWNPCEQAQPTFPRNPFAIRAVREGMQFLIDKDFIVRDIWGGFAVPFRSTFHPRSPDYSRYIVDFLTLEDRYAFNPEKGRSQINAALLAAKWSIGADGKWHDPEGRLVTITGLIRTQDERLQMGRYYAGILRDLGFDVVNNEGPRVAGVAYGGPCDQNRWHYYTAGWIQTAFSAWDDSQLWFFFGAGCELFGPFCGPGFYAAPQELIDIGDKLVFGQYKSLDERKALIVRGSEIAMQESLSFFLEARRSLYVYNKRMTNPVFDLFGGNANDFAFKAARVPDDPDGVARARILNLVMFVAGWNPWLAGPNWLYDAVQQIAMIDSGVTRHPHTGKVIGMRQHFTVETAGPDGTLAVPADAIEFNTTTNTWTPIGTGVTAISKVTYDMDWGKWHHGVDVSMDDLLMMMAIVERQVDGDLSRVPGLANAADDFARQVHTTSLKGIRVVDADTIEQYVDYWHPDPNEIAGFHNVDWPVMPWEACAVGVKTLLDQETANNEEDAFSTGRPWLDFTKGDSLPFLAADLATLSGANFIPVGFGPYITAAEATARWSALNTWYTTYGHLLPSHGPFYLDKVDVANRQTIMKAFRTGYPYDADHWNAFTTFKQPIVTFAAAPPFVFAGTVANFDFTVSIAGAPSDDFASQYFLRDVSTGAFKAQGAPTRTATGAYRIGLTATVTESLLLGTFELLTVVTATEYGVPSIERTSFLVTPPSVGFIQALLDARATLIENDLDALSTNLGSVQADIKALSASTASLQALVTAMAILAVVAVVVSVVSVVLVLRRPRVPPSPPATEGTEGGPLR